MWVGNLFEYKKKFFMVKFLAGSKAALRTFFWVVCHILESWRAVLGYNFFSFFGHKSVQVFRA